jgi:hypothetical protein
MIAGCQYALQGLSLWCPSPGTTTALCCTQNAECKVMITATEWPPYTALNLCSDLQHITLSI